MVAYNHFHYILLLENPLLLEAAFTLQPCVPLFLEDLHHVCHVKESLPKILLILYHIIIPSFHETCLLKPQVQQEVNLLVEIVAIVPSFSLLQLENLHPKACLLLF